MSNPETNTNVKTNPNVQRLLDRLEERYRLAIEHPTLIALFALEDQIPMKEIVRNFTHMAFTFADLNRYLVPYANPQNAYEEVINEHSIGEDATHYLYLLDDLKTLDLDVVQPYSETCLDIWRDRNDWMRVYIYSVLTLHTRATNIARKWAFMMANEATVDLFFDGLTIIGEHFQKKTGKTLRYVAGAHLAAEREHAFDKEGIFHQMEMSDEDTEAGLDIIDTHFEDFQIFIHAKWLWALELAGKTEHVLEPAGISFDESRQQVQV